MKSKLFLASILFLMGMLSACGSPLPPHIAVQFATPSPTPFLPKAEQSENSSVIDSSPLIEETAETNAQNNEISEADKNVVWGDFPEPSFLSDVEIPNPFPAFTLDDSHQNILILGSDQRPDDGAFRTDVILLLSIDETNETANLLSIPRDLYVYQPGYRMDRINSAQSRGGAELTFLTFEYNFGFRPDHYILVNFDGFRNIIDSLGGIDVDVAQPISDHRDSFGTFTIDAGTVHMDAETALWYVRSRGTSNDFDRTRRQQEIFVSIFKSAFTLDLFRNAPDLFQAYKQTISSDLGLGDVLQLLPIASKIYSNGSIGKLSIGPDHVSPWITSGNAQVLLPDQDKLIPLLKESLFIPFSD